MMTIAPGLADDRLGPCVGTYRVPLSLRLLALLVAAVVSPCAWLLALLFLLVPAGTHDRVLAIGAVVLAPCFAALGAAFALNALRLWRLRVTLHVDGVAVRHWRRVTAATWDEVRAVTFARRSRIALPLLIVLVVLLHGLMLIYLLYRALTDAPVPVLALRDGRRVTLPGRLCRKTDLGQAVDAAVADHQAPALLERLRGGLEATFGDLVVTARGVRYRDHTLPWSQFSRLVTTPRACLVYAMPGQRPWATIPWHRLDNPSLCHRAIAQVRDAALVSGAESS